MLQMWLCRSSKLLINNAAWNQECYLSNSCNCSKWWGDLDLEPLNYLCYTLLSVQVPTTGASSPRTTPHRIAGLDGLSRAAYEHDLGHLWKNFESKLLDLFVDIPPKSRVGVATAERDQIRWVSTPEELCTTLEKGVSTLL